MKLKTIKTIILGIVILATASAHANVIAEKDGVVFVLSNGTLSAYLASSSDQPLACSNGLISAPTLATGLLISGHYAILTPGANSATFDSIDISACLSEESSNDHATFDSKKGTLKIPCVTTDDSHVYDVTMQQRGSSMNWEVTFFEPSTSCVAQTN